MSALRKPVAAKKDDDIYEGYDELASAPSRILASVARSNPTGPLGTRRPPGAAGAGAGALPSQMRAPGSAAGSGGDTGAGGNVHRALSSVRGAGYSSGKPAGAGLTTAAPMLGTQRFDPLGQATQGPAPALAKTSTDGPEQQARELEKAVHRALEETASLTAAGQKLPALEMAKEAVKREHALVKHRKATNTAEQNNMDLTFAAAFALAHAYQSAGMANEAIGAYTAIAKDREHPLAGRVKVNIGNIYFQLKKYVAAIKMYRMAVDQLDAGSHRALRMRIMRNIGVAHLRTGSFHEAIQAFEAVLELDGTAAGGPIGSARLTDAQTVFNLFIAHYATGDVGKMQRAFSLLLSVKDEFETAGDEDAVFAAPGASNPFGSTVGGAFSAMGLSSAGTGSGSDKSGADDLVKEMRVRQKRFHSYVQTAARLLAPAISPVLSEGYDWVMEELKNPSLAHEDDDAAAGEGARVGAKDIHGGFPHIAMELEIAKGIAYLKNKQIAQAYEVFQSFEARDQGLVDQAATNLSFLYFLEGDFANAEAKADVAVRADRYNARALVNKANIHFVKDELDAARELYLEAIGVEADCVEAIYNLGLCNKRLGQLPDALQAFKKLHRLVPKDPQVIYHIGNLYDVMREGGEAAEWFKILHGVVPNDAKVLARIGSIACRYESEAAAAQFFLDAHHVYPVALEVISWLGVWYVKQGNHEEAIKFFHRAALIEPHEGKWRLMVAACYRRMGDTAAALGLYKAIHAQDPDSVECLKYLAMLTRELGDPQAAHFAELLAQAERAHAANMAGGAGGYGDHQSQAQQLQQQQQYEQQQQQQMQMEEARAQAQYEQQQMQQQDDEELAYQQHQAYQQQVAMQQQQQQQHQQQGFGLTDNADMVAPAHRGAPVNMPGAPNTADDWGDGDLGDELLPM